MGSRMKNEEMKAAVMAAITKLSKLCPKTVYIVHENRLERMRVDTIKISLGTPITENYGKLGYCSGILLEQNTRQKAPGYLQNLCSVVLDEDEAIRQWKETA